MGKFQSTYLRIPFDEFGINCFVTQISLNEEAVSSYERIAFHELVLNTAHSWNYLISLTKFQIFHSIFYRFCAQYQILRRCERWRGIKSRNLISMEESIPNRSQSLQVKFIWELFIYNLYILCHNCRFPAAAGDRRGRDTPRAVSRKIWFTENSRKFHVDSSPRFVKIK